MLRKMTTDEFIETAKKTHGEKYDYSLVEYKNSKTKVTIICPKHGEFVQNPYNHATLGRECERCSYEERGKAKEKNSQHFIKKSKETHGEKYDYSLVEYKGSHSKVKIICKVHGVFLQSPSNHYQFGCTKCGYESSANYCRTSQEDFISNANEKHKGKYDYSLVQYSNCDDKVEIICEDHGVFEQSPDSHLRGSGCLRCYQEQRGVGINERNHFQPYLESLIPLITIENQYPVKSENYYYFLDFYLPEFDIAIEYDEKSHYKKSNMQSDAKRQKYIEDKLGCLFVRVSDDKFMENNEYVDEIIYESLTNMQHRYNLSHQVRE
jgi:very-short-patch-repair endonuclease